MLIGAEFLAMILIVVYVGAVAVLFLFVVMMLDINFAEMREGFPAVPADWRADRVSSWQPNYSVFGSWVGIAGVRAKLCQRRIAAGGDQHPCARALIYTDYILLFQSPGWSCWCHDWCDRPDLAPPSGRAASEDQRSGRRRREDVIEIRDVTTGSGV